MYMNNLDLAHISLASFCGTQAYSAYRDQTPQNAAYDQDLHYLLTFCFIKSLNKFEKYDATNLKMEMELSNSGVRSFNALCVHIKH